MGIKMILVDAHVHIYDCFDLEIFLDSAFQNFKAEAARCGQEGAFAGVLLLTETAKGNWFQRLASRAGSEDGTETKPIGKWIFQSTKENCSLYVRSGNTQGLFLIAGRQVITAENLEVLALLTAENFQEGRQAQELIDAVKEGGGIPVIPWGFGKWSGKRKAVIKAILSSQETSGFFLGDNGGRLACWPRPFLFKFAERRGIKVLSGSDPLPFPSESRRPGSFGFWVEASMYADQPAHDLKSILWDPNISPKAYGALERPCRFLRKQFAMQVIKRRNGRRR